MDKPRLEVLELEELAASVAINEAECFGTMRSMPGAVWDVKPGFRRLLTGVPHPLFNGVYMARLGDDRRLVTHIREILRPFKQSRTPMLWIHNVACTPARTEEILIQEGLKLDSESTGIVLDLEDFTATPVPDDVEVRRASTLAELREGLDVMCEAFALPASLADAFCSWALSYGFDESLSFQSLVARRAGKPVAFASVGMAGGVAGIYNVATLSEERSKGIGTAVTYAACRLARRKGYRFMVGSGSEIGMRVYRKQAIREVGGSRRYALTFDTL